MGDLDHLNATGEDLHRDLLGGDVLASSKIAELFFPLLETALNRKYRNLSDPHLVGQAVSDALLNYLTTPQKFDPTRGTLFTYLWIAAQSDLLNYMQAERRRTNRKADEKLVELPPARAVNEKEEQQDPETELLLAEEASRVQLAINEIISDKTDRKIIELMLDGVRDTAAFAEILLLRDKPLEEQASLVKRTKDRIKIALRRGLHAKGSKG
jgi:RNA polymerase sigma factor (sigma-70 family)